MLITGFVPNPVNPGETKLKLVQGTEPAAASDAASRKPSRKQTNELSDADQQAVSKLKAIDTKVKQHEQAHLSAAAGLNVTPANFTYQKGPNGINYAVAGEVRIDTTPGRNPADTLAKAEQIIDAALAPADPSPADRSVAARAAYMAQQARTELQQTVTTATHSTHTHRATQVYEDDVKKSAGLDTYA
jgi:hypothetical protein